MSAPKGAHEARPYDEFAKAEKPWVWALAAGLPLTSARESNGMERRAALQFFSPTHRVAPLP